MPKLSAPRQGDADKSLILLAVVALALRVMALRPGGRPLAIQVAQGHLNLSGRTEQWQ